AFREAAPDPEPLVVRERVLQALLAHVARRAHALGLARGSALLGEERLRVRLRAQGAVLPGQGSLPAVVQVLEPGAVGLFPRACQWAVTQDVPHDSSCSSVAAVGMNYTGVIRPESRPATNFTACRTACRPGE